MLERICKGIGVREPFVLISGDPGTGKTTIAREAIRRLGSSARVAFVANPALSRLEFVEEIVRRFGVEPPDGASKPKLLACLDRVVVDAADTHKVPVIVVDDAHELTEEHVQELRYIVNASHAHDSPLEVVLVGLPSLAKVFETPSLAPMRQQIAMHCRVEPFTHGDTRRFLQEVMAGGRREGGPFTRKACREIHQESKGIARVVQALATEALRDLPPLETEKEDAPPAAEAKTAEAPIAEAPAEQTPLRSRERETQTRPEGAHEAEAVRPKPDTEGVKERLARLRNIEPRKRPEKEALPEIEPEPPTRLPAGGEADVQSWVGRFIAADEPRFGDLLKAQPSGDGDEGAGESPADKAARLAAVMAPPPRRRRRRRGGTGTLLGAASLLVIAVTVFAFILPRMRAAEPAGEKAQVASAEEAKTDGKSDTERATKGDAATSPEAAEQRPEEPKRYYTLDVGAFRQRSSAEIERERLVEATGLKGWILTESSGTGDSYRVIVGVYSSRQRAEWGAGLLTERQLVAQAGIVPLPPRSERR